MYLVSISSSLIFTWTNSNQAFVLTQLLTLILSTSPWTRTATSYIQVAIKVFDLSVVLSWFFTPPLFLALSFSSFETLHLPNYSPILNGCSFSVAFTGSSLAPQSLNVDSTPYSVLRHLYLVYYTHSLRDLIESHEFKSTCQLNTQPYSFSSNLSPKLQAHICNGHFLLNRYQHFKHFPHLRKWHHQSARCSGQSPHCQQIPTAILSKHTLDPNTSCNIHLPPVPKSHV